MSVPTFEPTQPYMIQGIGPYAILHPYEEGAIIARVVGDDGELITLDTAAVTLSPASSMTTGDLYLSAQVASQNVGRTLLIERDTDAVQGWEARYGDREVGMERQLDREVMAIQELKRQMLTTLRGTTAMAAYQPEAGRVPVVTEDGAGWMNGPSGADIYGAISGVASLNVDLAAERAARIAGDFGLSAAIAGERTARAAGDYFLQTQISAIAGGSAITTENSFATRDAFVAWDATATGKIAGMVIYADGLPYVYDGVSSAIPDLPGWVPGPEWWLGHFGPTGDGMDITAVFRTAFKALLADIRSGVLRQRDLHLPAGILIANDELIDDADQALMWSAPMTSNGRRGRIIFHDTIIQIGPNWPSSVRNTANGNQRTYGPWANNPSPSILFPLIWGSDVARACISLVNANIRGRNMIGRDPIAVVFGNDLDAEHESIRVSNCGMWGVLCVGCYNSTYNNLSVLSTGYQAFQGGKVLDGAAGFPTPRCAFNLSGTTLTAFAKSGLPGYVDGAPIPFFTPNMLNKAFYISSAATPYGQTLRAQLTAIASDGLSATIAPLDGATPGNVTGMAGSLTPMKYSSTADSDLITLSDQLLIGRGARDMVGQIVVMEQAGTTLNTRLGALTAIITECLNGNDTDGYLQVRVSHPARFSRSGEMIRTGGAMLVGKDELWRAADIAAGREERNTNDARFVGLHLEKSSGYTHNVPASAAMLVMSDAGSDVKFTGGKIHGCTASDNSMFAGDWHQLMDACFGVHFANVSWVHHTCSDKGIMRVTGADSRMTFASCEAGSWKMLRTQVGMYLDPLAGSNIRDWNICAGFTISNRYFGTWGDQHKFGHGAALTEATWSQCLLEKELPRPPAKLLTSANALNAVVAPGDYYWTDSVPSNSPAGVVSQYSAMQIVGTETRLQQRVIDFDNRWEITRFLFGTTWSDWRMETVLSGGTAVFTSATSSINTVGKQAGVTHFNTDTGLLMTATGSAATAPWRNGATTLTPA
ncbi:hypothetical protein D2T29_00590 [Sinirhodobacter populi]|uniref:Uncharacterized protein n=1 Tax=Paenirhodobacter populi TaxID=2306993 RepID=A0A443KQ22_9RHOB|nr:hypothetical protein [Sinirhodobacter populi]RWR35009.1 hypothetical protein D2T29_00590 [Sinirhodobacter populi]